MVRIAALLAERLDIALTETFGIATGAQASARNVLLRVVLDDGCEGLGEAAPFPAVSGETQELVLDALGSVSRGLIGAEAEAWRVAASVRTALSAVPSALCAIETALLDALCRRHEQSMWKFFGGNTPMLETDVTIVTGSVEQARRAAERAFRQGFSVLKIKVGGSDAAHDAARIAAIAETAPAARLLLDANASMSAETAIELVAMLGSIAGRIDIFEQPTETEDLEGLAFVRARTGLRIAADESARNAADVTELVTAGAVDLINIKIMKSGISEAIAMIEAAERAGLGLMVGGMVESKLAMTTSACLAAGRGGFTAVDLDTPMFMADAPTEGGFIQQGPKIYVDRIGRGHGVAIALAQPTHA